MNAMTSTTIMKASNQWATRPSDERFVSLGEMAGHFATIRGQSSSKVVPSRRLFAKPMADHQGMEIVGPNGHPFTPTHWSFGQVAGLAEAPAGYLRRMPSDIAADCINYGLQFVRGIEDVGVLLQSNGDNVLRAATGPNYGRVWNADIVDTLIRRFGDGEGSWRVPGEFGKRVVVTRDNTTLYASDRDMFVFLADEENRIDVPNRRSGAAGQMARGFFVWNSEVGSKSLGIAMFLFDYVCCNRIVWGAQGYTEMTLRHTASAPDKWLEELEPALVTYRTAATSDITGAIRAAQAAKVSDDVDAFLKARFGSGAVAPMKAAHMLEEQRPIETLWDVTTAATAYAKGIAHQDARIVIEKKAGEVLKLAV